jgi:hypothetical protein
MIDKFIDGITPLNKATFDPIIDTLNGISSLHIYRVVEDVSNISSIKGAKVGDLIISGDGASRNILGKTVTSVGACIRITSDTTGEILKNTSLHESTRVIDSIPGLTGKLFIKTVATAWTSVVDQSNNFPGNKIGDYIFNASPSMSSIFGQELVSGGLVQITQASVPTNPSILGVGKERAYILLTGAGVYSHDTCLYTGTSTGVSNAITSNGGTYLKLTENGTVKSSKLIKGTGTTTVTSDSSGNITINTPPPESSEITEIFTQYIRIWNLSAGVYKLTYAGTKYLYYMGHSSTTTHTVVGDSGTIILTINTCGTTVKHWYYINYNGSTVGQYLYHGYTTLSSGAVAYMILPIQNQNLGAALVTSSGYNHTSTSSTSVTSGYHNIKAIDDSSWIGSRLQFRWGTFHPGGNNTSVSFRSAFTTACVWVYATLFKSNETTSSLHGIKVRTMTSSAFTCVCTYQEGSGGSTCTNSTDVYVYFAVGY